MQPPGCFVQGRSPTQGDRAHSMSQPESPPVPRPPIWLVAATVTCAAYSVCLLLDVLPRGTGPGFLGSMNALSAWAMWRASRRAELPAPTRRGLRFIAAGMVSLVLGTIYQNALILFDRDNTIFNFSDVFFLGVYPCFLGGLACLPADPRRVTSRGRILVDGAVYLVGVGMPVWLFAVQPQLAATSGMERVLLVVWPLAALCGIFGVNAALLSKTPLPSRGALWLLIGGVAVSWLADLIFSLDAAAQIVTSGPINWINLTNTGSLVMLLFAAWRFGTEPVPPRPTGYPAAFSPVPIFTILLVVSWLAVLSLQPAAGTVPVQRVLPALLLLFLVLLVREVLVLRESQRWMAAEAARESRARFEALVRNSSDLILVVDGSLRIQFASPAAHPLLGLMPDELSGRPLLELAHSEDQGALTGFLRGLGRDGTSRLKWRVRHRDGSYRHWESAGANLMDEPSIGGLVLNSRDITERVVLEESLGRATKMEAIGRLSGGVAHDFNNLLAVILANGELTLLDLPADHPARSSLDAIKAAVARGTELTRRLLSFSNSENAQPRVVSPGDILRSVRPALHRIINGKQLLHIQISPEAGSVKVNPEQLEQAFVNLATNARDAMPTGGTLTLSVRAATLATPLPSPYLTAAPGRYVLIETRDTGTGMNAATKARLFEPFFSTRKQGRGLGLAAVYAMVKLAQGGITVSTLPGQGTTFELWLPEVAPEPVPASRPRPAGSGGTETILIVDDEPQLQQVTARVLRAKGYHVLVGGDADDARTVIAGHTGPIHLLLSDVIMPGQSGPALAADLVARQPNLRVLFMSGFTGNELAAHGLAHNSPRLIVKPFTVDELVERIGLILAGPPGCT